MNQFANRAEKLIFRSLVFLLPSQLGYHYFAHFSYVFGIRVDYLAPTLYLTDLLVLALLVLWILKKPSLRIAPWLAAVVLFVFINALFSNVPLAALYKWAKFLELALLGYWVYANKELDIKKEILVPLSLGVIFFTAIGALQIIFQKTLGGVLYVFGERTFSSSTPGIALFSMFGRELLRPYSTFSHPNSLAGFMLTAVWLIVALKDKNKNLIVLLAVVVGSIAVFISGSLGAALAFLVVIIFYLIYRKKESSLGKASQVALLILIIISLLSPVILDRTKEGFVASEDIYNRALLSVAAAKAAAESIIYGAGMNNFISQLPRLTNVGGASWLLQPPHNTSLLLLAEAGLIGLTAFSYLVYRALGALKKNPYPLLALPLLAILFTGLVDHYWLTLQQNQLLFSLVLGLSFRKKF